MNSLVVARDLGSMTSQVLEAFARSAPSEYVHSVHALIGVARALFPLQMSIFDELSRNLTETNPQRHLSGTSLLPSDESDPSSLDEPWGLHPYSDGMSFSRPRPLTAMRRAARNRATDEPFQPPPVFMQSIVQASGGTDSTADSWRTRVPPEEVSGEEGWQLRAVEAIREKYGYEIAAIPEMEQLKRCLSQARHTCTRADEKVARLTIMKANAIHQENKYSELIRVNEQAVPSVGDSARGAVQALAAFANCVGESYLQACKESLDSKRQLYMLQSAWTAALGGTASLIPLCGICMQRGVDIVCTPCGHTYCQTCAAGLGKKPNASRYDPVTPCHVCRATVQTKQKLFFS